MNFETNREQNRPWEYSTGPVTTTGKLKSSKNSYKHGYYREVFRKFRMNKRKPETIRIEGMCHSLIRAVGKDSLDDLNWLITDISKSILKIWQSAELTSMNNSTLVELMYTVTLCESVIRYSTAKITRKLNRIMEEYNEKR